MAEGNGGGGGGMGLLGVIVGAVLVIGLLFFFMGGMPGSTGSAPKNIDVTIKAPAPASAPAPAAPAAPAAPKQ